MYVYYFTTYTECQLLTCAKALAECCGRVFGTVFAISVKLLVWPEPRSIYNSSLSVWVLCDQHTLFFVQHCFFLPGPPIVGFVKRIRTCATVINLLTAITVSTPCSFSAALHVKGTPTVFQ